MSDENSNGAAGTDTTGGGGDVSLLEGGGAALGTETGADGADTAAGADGDAPWYAALPEARHEALKGFADQDAALVGLLERADTAAEGMVRIPGEDATDEDRAAFYKALGRPDAPDGYALAEGYEVPEGVTLGDEVDTAWKQRAHELGLSQAQYRGVMDFALTNGAKGEAQVLAEQRAFQADEVAELRKLHGAGTAQLLDAANAAAMALGGKEFIAALGAAGNDRHVIAALAKVAPLVTEGKLKDGGTPPGPGGPVTRAAIEKAMEDPRYADPDRRDPAYVAEVREMCKRVTG